uniref:Trafficking protein particle complex subunit 5 n=1 Tax=Romanomermis culicivorax TaxID=13658 RepID=A0A915II76_ROMCU
MTSSKSSSKQVGILDRTLSRAKNEINISTFGLLFCEMVQYSQNKNIFGKEADKLERSSENPCHYYIIEKEPLVNTFISIPKDKGSLNCASFTAGLLETVLTASNFPCKVSAVWHNGTTYVIEFEEAVINREKPTS